MIRHVKEFVSLAEQKLKKGETWCLVTCDGDRISGHSCWRKTGHKEPHFFICQHRGRNCHGKPIGER